MTKLTDEQLRILERGFWVETGVVEQGQRETIFDYVGFARAAIAASQETNSNAEEPKTISEVIKRFRNIIATKVTNMKFLRFFNNEKADVICGARQLKPTHPKRNR